MRLIYEIAATILVGAFAVFVCLLIFGCAGGHGFLAMSDAWCAEHDYPAAHCTVPATASYDQANLKAGDRGCPTAIYVAPNGILEQCGP